MRRREAHGRILLEISEHWGRHMGQFQASDGRSLEWAIMGNAKTGFSSQLKVIQSGKILVEADACKSFFASRHEAIAWLRAEARARGFDASGIR
jgi:hypothetical protein